MNASLILEKVAKALYETKLEVVLIGNAAAAIQGAPVTTIDLDFMYRKTPLNREKINQLAQKLNGTVSQPFALSSMLRLEAKEGIHIDFLDSVDGVKSFASIRSRSQSVKIDKHKVLVSSLEDIIKSKEACGRLKDIAVLELLKQTLVEQQAITKANNER